MAKRKRRWWPRKWWRLDGLNITLFDSNYECEWKPSNWHVYNGGRTTLIYREWWLKGGWRIELKRRSA